MSKARALGLLSVKPQSLMSLEQSIHESVGDPPNSSPRSSQTTLWGAKALNRERLRIKQMSKARALGLLSVKPQSLMSLEQSIHESVGGSTELIPPFLPDNVVGSKSLKSGKVKN